MEYQNAEGSTGYLKDGAFVPFKDQAEADNNGPEADTEKPAPKKAPAKAD